MSIESLGYRVVQLDSQDLSTFRSFVETETWTPDPDMRYKEIPEWANHMLNDIDDLDVENSYEFCVDKYCPAKYRQFGLKMIRKYIPDFADGITLDRVGITFWNGAEETGWHTDDDGNDGTIGDIYVFLMYHVPDPLDLEDGANIHFATKTPSGRVLNSIVIPTDGMGILINIQKDKFEHKATWLSNLRKNRYTMLVGVVHKGHVALAANRKRYNTGDV